MTSFTVVIKMICSKAEVAKINFLETLATTISRVEVTMIS